MPLWLILTLLLVALITATISGMVGMGGGVTLLGVMTALLPARVVVPIHGVVQLCSNFSRTLAFLGHVRWRIFAWFAPLACVGIVAATTFWASTKLGWFRPLVGLVILAFLASRRYAPKLRNLPMWSYAPLGLAAGMLTIFVGATGPFLAPFFLRDDLEKEEIIATKAVCQALLHLFKIPAFMALGFDYGPHMGLLVGMGVAVIIGTLLGKRILARLSTAWFLLLFQGVLLLLALYLIGAWWLR